MPDFKQATGNSLFEWIAGQKPFGDTIGELLKYFVTIAAEVDALLLCLFNNPCEVTLHQCLPFTPVLLIGSIPPVSDPPPDTCRIPIRDAAGNAPVPEEDRPCTRSPPARSKL
jgi:hypothetical protein